MEWPDRFLSLKLSQAKNAVHMKVLAPIVRPT
jgi:hypothetical protein